MIHDKKIIVVMPAYNAEGTLRQTYSEVDQTFVDEVILVDDASSDSTVKVAEELGIETIVHLANKGYGANQKTCYRAALDRGADVVIMLHPDYQYTPKLLVAMASMVAVGGYDVVLGSRILTEGALKGGMPVYKYMANRVLTLLQNTLLSKKLSEYHTGYRAFSSEVLMALPLNENSDDFVFDNQMLSQIAYFGFSIGELSCPTKYFAEASSINFQRSVIYGLGVVATSILYRLNKWELVSSRIFDPNGRRLNSEKSTESPCHRK
ncbi:Glycosyl transferase, group 2 family [hydrothermal vent metagenome]|uniref:Glycosyl transferase, group 2 family n=1 Tax=hydrothermal vent metagenome TaxID=652676 RepID=A0A3B1BIF0_9ZZZZ